VPSLRHKNPRARRDTVSVRGAEVEGEDEEEEEFGESAASSMGMSSTTTK